MKTCQILIVVMLAVACLAFSQGIQVKTVPILSGEQFSMVPSFRDDMGSVSIAVRDPLQDLFSNPGKFNGETRSVFFSAPMLQSWDFERETGFRSNWTMNSSSVQTSGASSSIFSLPLGFILRNEHFYVGGLAALQSLDAKSLSTSDFEAMNYPLAILSGFYVPSLRTAVGVALNYVSINGMDGVYLLYPDASRLRQNGSAKQVRMGVAGDLGANNRWSLLGMRYYYRMDQSTEGVENLDQNDGWLAQADYMRDLDESWRLGVSVTGDWRYHPKIPDYPLAGIPRDPGHTRAMSLGVGLQWQQPGVLWGIDALYEPIDVKTWADAAADMETWDGRKFLKGQTTQRNDYQFHNRVVRTGVEIKPFSRLSLRSGAQMRFYEYDYYQNDFINRSETTGNPQRAWTEVTWSAGATVKLGKWDVSYSLRMHSGTGLLERQWFWFWRGMENASMDFAKVDFIIPPTVQLNVTPVTYYTQRLVARYSF